MEMYKHALGLRGAHPAPGLHAAVADAVAGHIEIVATSVPAGLPFVRQGRLKPIALMSRERSPSAPEIPEPCANRGSRR